MVTLVTTITAVTMVTIVSMSNGNHGEPGTLVNTGDANSKMGLVNSCKYVAMRANFTDVVLYHYNCPHSLKKCAVFDYDHIPSSISKQNFKKSYK